MYFQKLPNEVIQHIFSELPTSDLKALSLVCKELDARVTPLFFSCLAFWLGPEDLDRYATSLDPLYHTCNCRLNNISDSPQFRNLLASNGM